jgi:hypothetical protein
VTGECELFHVVSRDRPLLGNQLRPGDLVQLDITEPGPPAVSRARMTVPGSFAIERRARQRHHAHVLDATGDHDVLRTGHLLAEQIYANYNY